MRIKQSTQVLFHKVGTESVLLDLASESYFSLDETGTRLWELASEHDRLDDIYEMLLAEYDVSDERLRAHVEEILEKMTNAGLLSMSREVADETSNER